MRKDSTVFVKHILESISFIESYTAQMSKADFIDSLPFTPDTTAELPT
jgi:uncharacterized protein with HEPN domain